MPFQLLLPLASPDVHTVISCNKITRYRFVLFCSEHFGPSMHSAAGGDLQNIQKKNLALQWNSFRR